MSSPNASPPPPVAPICPEPGSGPSPFPPDLPATTTISAGTIPGAFSVTSTGEATYSMSLTVPPGRNGMQPSLSIAYDSSAGEGLVGTGFSIGGLSEIARCPKTIAQDGGISPVRDKFFDALCLDGKRLVPINFDNGQIEYRTLPDSFTRVVAHFGDDQ